MSGSSTPEWMLKFQQIGQKGEEEVTTLDQGGTVVKTAEPSKRQGDTDGIPSNTVQQPTLVTQQSSADYGGIPNEDVRPTEVQQYNDGNSSRLGDSVQASDTYEPSPSQSQLLGQQYDDGNVSTQISSTSRPDGYNETQDPAMSTRSPSQEFGESWVVNREDVTDNGTKQDGSVNTDEPLVSIDGVRHSMSDEGSNDIDDEENQDRLGPLVSEPRNQYYDQQQQHVVESVAQPQYYSPYSIEDQFKVLHPTSGKRSQLSYMVAVVAFLLIVSAILLVVFLVGLDDTNVSGQLPTMSPTAFEYPPLGPTNNGNIESAATTPMDPFQDSCDFTDLTQPNVVDQCDCRGTISILADDVVARWNDLVTSFIPSVFPNWNQRISSCSAENQALVWMSTGINNGGEIDNIVRLQRYSMAYLYYQQGGVDWRQSDGWLSDRNVCTWENVVCDSSSYIQSIVMNQNRLSGQLSDAVALLNAIETVSFSNNALFGPIPISYFENESLITLDLSSNDLTGVLAFSNETKLELLNLRNNDFAGTLTPDVKFLTSMKSFDLSSNRLTGSLPTDLFTLPLIELSIGNNNFEGTLPQDLFSTTSLTSLSLGPNLFTGTLPSDLANLTNLERFSLIGVSEMSGRLPAQYGLSLSNLVHMTISSTSVSGNIPGQFGAMSKLETLRLDNNKLGRQIPAEMGQLTALEVLDLSSNTFSGAIPGQLGLMISAQELRFQTNRLSGSIPDEFSGLSNLEVLTLDDNFMSGRAPEGVCNLRDNNLAEFVVDCPSQVGQSQVVGIICDIPDCCTECV